MIKTTFTILKKYKNFAVLTALLPF
jgi:hypothetical protein